MPCNIHSLPNEILIQILSPFSTRTLLPLAPTSPLFSSIVHRILRYRLLLAAALPPSYNLILEAYHPTRKYSEPYLFCTYLGTPGLSPRTHEDSGKGCLPPSPSTPPSEGQSYATLAQLYSRFRPERPGVEGRRPSRTTARLASPFTPPASDSTPSSSSSSASSPVFTNGGGDGGSAKISHSINLDSHELFSQFCTIANLVEVGPRRGVFLSVVNVEEKVMRVWRGWLEGRARVADEMERNELKKKRRRKWGKRGIQSKVEDEEDEEESNDESAKLEEEDRENEDTNTDTPAAQEANSIATDPSILWTDINHNVGLRVAVVKDRKWHRNGSGPEPILITAEEEEEEPEEDDDDEQSVSYNLEIKELIIRTTHLMLAVEESLDQHTNVSGKAMIFGSFATGTNNAASTNAAES